jgi:hypothetical protein
LLRRAIIVDAPDLPPEECEFYITSEGIADNDKEKTSETKKSEESSEKLDIETLYEEEPGNENIENDENIADVSTIRSKKTNRTSRKR